MPSLETDIRKIKARLEREGWIGREGGNHKVYTHPEKPGRRAVVPQGRGSLPPGTARDIAKAAGWL